MPHFESALKKRETPSLYRTLDDKRHRTGLVFYWLSLVFFSRYPLLAQTGGEAGIQGTVTDAEGAAIPNATVTVTNDATGVALTRQTTGDGLYTVSPILPGTYTVRVKAQGFSDFIQKNLIANALVMTSLNLSMKVGAADTTVEVTDAPPQLVTTNATLGLTVENTTYANLPLAHERSAARSHLRRPALARAPRRAHVFRSLAAPATILDSSTSMAFRPRPSASRATTASSRRP